MTHFDRHGHTAIEILSANAADLVARVVHSAGYNLLSFTRAFAVLNCQSALVCFLLRSASHASTSCFSTRRSGRRRSRHWDDRTPSSDSAMSSQLPCLGV